MRKMQITMLTVGVVTVSLLFLMLLHRCDLCNRFEQVPNGRGELAFDKRTGQRCWTKRQPVPDFFPVTPDGKVAEPTPFCGDLK